jgi:kinetochore protein NDC80
MHGSIFDCRYREQVEKVNKLREETVRAIVKNSNETLLFKEEVSQQLRNLRQFAEEN